MKKLYHVCLFLALLSLVFSGGYYFLSMMDMKKEWKENRFSDGDIREVREQKQQIKTEQEKKEAEHVFSSESAVYVNAAEEKLLASAECILITYDAFSNTTSLSKEKPDPEWIGLNRNELAEKIENSRKHPSLEETELGLTGMELLEFSPDRIKLRKTYDRRNVRFRFFAALWEGMVVIYHSDRKTVYEYTGIDYKSLGEEEQRELIKGIPLKDEEQLYGLLESYSS